ENKFLNEDRASFLSYIASKTILGFKNMDLFFSRIDDFYGKAEAAFKTLSTAIKHAKPEELFCNSALLKRQLLDFSIIEFGSASVFNKVIASSAKPSVPSSEMASSHTPRHDASEIVFN